jgi:hypothetical protein
VVWRVVAQPLNTSAEAAMAAATNVLRLINRI